MNLWTDEMQRPLVSQLCLKHANKFPLDWTTDTTDCFGYTTNKNPQEEEVLLQNYQVNIKQTLCPANTLTVDI